MKQFNQLSPQAQTTIIQTLLSLYTGDLPQHVKDEIAEWKIYSTNKQPEYIKYEDWLAYQNGHLTLYPKYVSGVDWGAEEVSQPQQVTSEPVQLREPTSIEHQLFKLIDETLYPAELTEAMNEAVSVTVNYSENSCKTRYSLGLMPVRDFLTGYAKLKEQHRASTY